MNMSTGSIGQMSLSKVTLPDALYMNIIDMNPAIIKNSDGRGIGWSAPPFIGLFLYQSASLLSLPGPFGPDEDGVSVFEGADFSAGFVLSAGSAGSPLFSPDFPFSGFDGEYP